MPVVPITGKMRKDERGTGEIGCGFKKRIHGKCMEEWINSDPQRKAKYGDVLSTLQEAYISTNELAKYTTYFLETFQNGIEIIRFANTLLQFDANGTQQEKEEFINDRIINAYKNYNPDLDKKVMAALMELYAERVPEQYHPDIYKTIRKNSRAITVNMPIGCLNVRNYQSR